MESIPHSIFKKYGVHPPFHGKIMESIHHSMESIPHFMDSIFKKSGVHPPVHGFHPPFHGIHLKNVWSPSPIPWKKYGVHPPFHGFHLKILESTPHSMDSIWIIPGRVKYSSICISGHYYLTHHMQGTCQGLIHSLVLHQFLTNIAHPTCVLLHYMVLFYHMNLIEDDIPESCICSVPLISFCLTSMTQT